jgi:hypothetical protein
MKLPRYVKPLPKFLSRFWFKGFTVTFFKTIFLRREIFDDLQSNNPTIQNLSVLKHEEAHLKRVGKLQALKFLFPKLRLQEELIAYREQFRFLKQNHETYNLDNVAKHLPGVDYESAKKLISKLWQES